MAMLGHPEGSDYLALVARELWLERSRARRWRLGSACFLRWPYIAPSAANLADSRTRPTDLCAHSHRVYLWYGGFRRPGGMESRNFLQRCRSVLGILPGILGQLRIF